MKQHLSLSRARHRAAAAAVAVAALALGACSPSEADPVATEPASSEEAISAPAIVQDASIDGMRVLLTNDDSMQASRENNSDGLGLYALRGALCDAGADVVVIAPWGTQSGRGTAVTNSGSMSLGEAPAVPADHAGDCADAPSGGAVYGLCLGSEPCTAESVSATPVDTVKFALRGGLAATVGWDENPDLVVTGPNAGLNVASSVNDSGTIGAAIAGVEHRVPSVAFSTSADSTFGYYPVENYAATATWAVEFLEGLAARDLLGQHEFVLTVNYPDVSGGTAAAAARFVEVGTAAFAFHSYPEAGDGSFEVALAVCEGSELCEERRAAADWVAVLTDGAITVGAIDPDRTYGADLGGLEELDAIRQYVETDAPAPVS